MLRVLVVDDDHDIRETLQELLMSRGHEVDVAENGQEALDLLEATHGTGKMPEMLLLDLSMPIMTGDELLKVLNKDDRFSDLPVVIMSANLELMRFQRRTCLAKPFSIDRLFKLLDAWPVQRQA